MTLLKLPLTFSSAGVLEQADRSEDVIAPRIRFFLYKSMGEYRRPDRHPAGSDSGAASPGALRDKTSRKDLMRRHFVEQGMTAVWSELHVMGKTQRLSALFEGEDGKSDLRSALETAIRDQMNKWFDGITTIESVRLLPYRDPTEQESSDENGISIRTDRRDYTFIFDYALPGHTGGTIGSWTVREDFHARR